MIYQSKYNVRYLFKDKYYIYNTLSGKYVEENKFGDDFTKDSVSISGGNQKLLLNKGILVEKKEDTDCIMEKFRTNKLKLMILASRDCNFRCKYCYEKYVDRNIDGIFVSKIEKFLNNSMRNYDSLYVEWFGGEPLLAKKKIIECSAMFLKQCYELKKPFFASITTNGYLLDYSTFEKLRHEHVFFYQITIDGMKEEHNYYRKLRNGKGTFDVILNNLLDIKNNVKKRDYFQILIRNNVTCKNLESCNEFRKLFERYFGQDSRFKLEQFPVQDWGGNAVKQIEKEMLNIRKEELQSAMVNIFESLESRTCICANKNGYVLDPDCNIYKCSHISQHENPIGYITEQGEMIISNKSFENGPNYLIKGECEECEFLPMCTVRCPLDTKIEPYYMCKNIQRKMIEKQLIQKVGKESCN